VLTSDLASQPVTVVVAALNGPRIVPFTLLMACGVVTAAVPGIVAVALNRFIISGVTSGAVKQHAAPHDCAGRAVALLGASAPGAVPALRIQRELPACVHTHPRLC
jgi:hypothetical protein